MRALLDVLAWEAVVPSRLDRTWTDQPAAWDAVLELADLRRNCGEPVFR